MNLLSTSNISQSIVLIDNDVLRKDAFESSVRESYSKRITWDTRKFNLVSSRLVVTVDQPATSGADLTLSVNGRKLERIEWHALDTGEKTEYYDITAYMLNGINDFVVLYNAPNHHLQGAEVQINVGLDLVFRALTSGDDFDPTPADEGGLKDNAEIEKFLNWLKDNVKMLAILGTITGAAVATIYVLKSGVGFPMRIPAMFRRFRR